MIQEARQKPRFVGIDLVKILACFLVVSVHFFLYTNFYNTPISNEFGRVPIAVRWFTYCCVPLFMVTTGYLMKNKKQSKQYYFGIVRVLVIYLFTACICYIFDFIHYPQKFDQIGGYHPWTFLHGLFMYNAAQYGWYVEYYICLFLLIPYLNMIYHGMKTQRKKQGLVLLCVLMFVFAPSFYIGTELLALIRKLPYCANFLSGITLIYKPAKDIKLLPGYFLRCYPIAYYYLGAYIREYPPKCSIKNKLLALAAMAGGIFWLTETTLRQSMLNSDNNFVMYSWHYNDYGSWPVAVCSLAIFLLVFDIRSSNSIFCGIAKALSNATFAAYLISYPFDVVMYEKLIQRYPDSTGLYGGFNTPAMFREMPREVPRHFALAMICELAIQGFYVLGERLIKNAIERHRHPVEKFPNRHIFKD